MGLNRRIFLQQARNLLLTLSATELAQVLRGSKSWAAPLTKSYLQTLAQPNARKLALLVGIDRYGSGQHLNGCATDVELQRELLIHRFGFNPRDILTLTNQQAAREDIETAFIEHLTEQAKPGDVVVFHFSGYGNRVQWSQTGESGDVERRLENSLLPADGTIPTKGAPAANDLLWGTLALLARSLPTQQLTMILDTSFAGEGKLLSGNLRSRSPLMQPAPRPNPQDLAFQEQLKSRFNLAADTLSQGRKSLSLPGTVFLAAREDEVATEGQWGEWSSGLFTYAFTRHLWQIVPASTLYIALNRTAESMQPYNNSQNPRLLRGSTLKPPFLTYSLLPRDFEGSEGVVIGIEENGATAQLHLAGLPAWILSNYLPNSRFWVVSESQEMRVQLQLQSRAGLTAKAKILTPSDGEEIPPVSVGQQVREWIRVLPRNLGLTVALSTELERIERVDATSAFSNVVAVSSVVTAGEQGADCLFGKLAPEPNSTPNPSEEESPETSSQKASASSYALFTVGRDKIPSTRGDAGEAIKLGVERLTPKLKILLAAKLLRLTTNEFSSRLGIRATLNLLKPEVETLMQRETSRSAKIVQEQSPTISVPSDSTQEVPNRFVNRSPLLTVDTRSPIQYRIENKSDRAIYVMMFGIDASGSAIALYASTPQESTDASKLQSPRIEGGKTLTLPTSSSFNATLSGAMGIVETFLVCAPAPFSKTLEVLASTSYPQFDGERLLELHNPLEVAKALLQDLHAASAVPPTFLNGAMDVYGLDVNAWATFRFVYHSS
ncbi:caspase family protein [Lusitaniella coriacea LEGE 07157]|uniref:Caspase family protein n=1 Tax=Lusitaniella coriacea LEGE 07157 TaxID=945747 RepID=A0A8J7B061_9CYAN|nr:caspase family protein [Lusitaniella coriacea]MBE9114660.1 caspase family protein [Lusitaniella coriacea LEGE 07157]